MRMIVFTDLDATLLDHESYSWAAAQPALDRLRAANIPVVLSSSKTLAEMGDLQQQLALQGPMICENGSVVLWPQAAQGLLPAGYRFVALANSDSGLVTRGAPRSQWLPAFQALRDRHAWPMQGFADWDDATIARHTGLSLAQAHLAAQRQGTEPVLWSYSDEQLLQVRGALHELELDVVAGGRFWHISSGQTKADGLGLVKTYYQQQWQLDEVLTIALGDSPNDATMLAAADRAVLVCNPHARAFDVATQQLMQTKLIGPAGWNEAMQLILDEYGVA